MTATYNHWLVFVSLLVAILASYTALDLATRITLSSGRAAQAWLTGGAFSMGIGIWSTHFVGMLAFHLPIAMSYDIPITITSLLIAIVTSAFALYIATRKTLTKRRLIAAGVLLGLGISAMHYAGMAAMEAYPRVIYEPLLFSASIVIAIASAFAALWTVFTLRDESSFNRYAKLGGAIIMGCAIAGMHYTAMAAAQFDPNTICLTGPLVDNSWIAGTMSAATFLILCVTLGLSVADTRMASKTAALAASLKDANAELRRLALQDPLTKLPNRLLLEDRIQQAIVHAGRDQVHCAVLFVDLDRFKVVNDSLGHSVGDQLLRAIAAKLQAIVRAEDTVSRLGGDEFVMLLREVVNVDDATNIASKILEALREPFRLDDHEFYVTPSIGISVFPLHGDTAQTLISRADAAMYSAKQAGRNTFQVFTADMATFFPERLTLENDLRRAVNRGEFELHYQPKARATDGKIIGMEALVRWRHPEKGLLQPADFIALADDTGLIVPIGKWIIEQACAQNKGWQNAGLPPLRVAINISGVQFRHKGLLDVIEDALASSGLAADCLEIEVTESVMMHNPSTSVVTLEKLSELGVHVSIDDFGTGYSSLSQLKRFPIDRLKIDRSFVRDISSDLDGSAIVRATIGLAHNLRLKVIAEGVETAEQLELLQALGCDEYQGYHKSRPLTAAQFEHALRSEFEVVTLCESTS